MGTEDSKPMESIISTLSSGFNQVPASAVPPMLDCILASTGFPPSSLFASLLDSFLSQVKDVATPSEDGNLDSAARRNYVMTTVAALCHLLKKLGNASDCMQSFIWRCFIPLIKNAHMLGCEVINQVAESFFDAVSKIDCWDVLGAMVVPFFIRAIGLSIGMIRNGETDVFKWEQSLCLQGPDSTTCDIDQDMHSNMSLSGIFPLPISCHVLTLVLDAALHSFQEASRSTTQSASRNSYSVVQKLFVDLLWDLCNISERLLLQSSEHRSCAINFLLPVIFTALVSQRSLEVSVHGCKWKLTSDFLSRKIWKCCRTLFSLGCLERKDAYRTLSLFLSFLSCVNQCEGVEGIANEENFDLRAEREFWDELKRGLVDDERLVRKQSLHVLKAALQISEEIQPHYDVSEKKKSQEKNSVPRGMTKRDVWADKEAKSLGVGKICYFDSSLNNYQQWEAFVLLHEMLEEYGTHLVEAAWNHQVTLLLQFCVSHENSVCTVGGNSYENQIDYSREIFSWLAILWQLGFQHENPQVRMLIMESFLGIEWSKYRDVARCVPESFVLGPFINGLNDPVHHNDFGVKGIYASRTIEGATRFMRQYTSYLIRRKGILFLHNLASVSKHQAFGRAGLMCLVECIASAACGLRANVDIKTESENDNTFADAREASLSNESPHIYVSDLLETFRYVIESGKQHFNPNYRLQVCEKALEAAAAVVSALDVPFEVLLHFISSIPREFTDYGGSLRARAQEWLLGCSKNFCTSVVCNMKIELLEKLQDFPERFTRSQSFFDNVVTYDDEDVNAWESEAKIWARILFLVMKEDNEFSPILKFIHDCGVEICNHQYKQVSPVKFLLLLISLFTEMQLVNAQASSINEDLSHVVPVLLEGLISFADTCCSIFWSIAVDDTTLPSSMRGKLGGPSQRRLSSSTTTRVLEAITLMRAIASILSLSAQRKIEIQFDAAWIFLWDFFWKVVSSPSSDSETAAEICLAAYEALVHVLRTLASMVSPLTLNLMSQCLKSWPSPIGDKYMLDVLLLSLSQHIDNLIAGGGLTRGRRAILLDYKWLCLESLLSIQCHALGNGLHMEDTNLFFSDAALKSIFNSTVESLENAGEGSVLPLLRSVRLTLELLASRKSCALVSSFSGINTQMMWHLVHSSWILHISSNKRRFACIAALLSSILHPSIFAEESMHFIDDGPGPLKWFVERVLQEGTKSPRTIRLAALHLTGLWLSHPRTIKYYIKELKLLTLHGSVAFDEDFEAELTDNHDTRIEVSLLAKAPDSELAEAFINTELYARVCVAVLFYKLAGLAGLEGSANGCNDSSVALESGKLFLLELLDSAVNDKDLSKELYKKYSAIHRRKIRAWQMICVMSPFVHDDILLQVTNSLHISLQRNNLPGVRQYLETFAINIYMKFPSLVAKQLVPIFQDYEMRPQALSSYVFIAANLILHASEVVRPRHLDDLLPPIVPLLTSHHHSLRGFTQLLVHQVFVKYFSSPDCRGCKIVPSEKRVLEDIRLYLAKNPDCMRLRMSMEGYLDAYDPLVSSTPAGIFINRVEDVEFECVPVSLMEEVLRFLNDVRDELRCAMAKDNVTIKNESLKFEDDINHLGRIQLAKDSSVDFQKKITLSKHEKQDNNASIICGKRAAFEELLEIEKEDDLLHQSLLSRSSTLGKIRANRQQLILVASLLDRIPNLAGLARTCEIFGASGLAIADASILRDKQFQLISVTAEKWLPVIEVPVNSVKQFLEKKKREEFSILGLEQTANSVPLDQFTFPNKTVVVLGREKEGIPVDIIHVLDACIEIPQLGVVRSLNVHVSGAIALWEYTRQQRSR